MRAAEGICIIWVPSAVGMKQCWEFFKQWSHLWPELCFLLRQTALWLPLVLCSGADMWDEKWFLGCAQTPQIPLFLPKNRDYEVYKKLQLQSMQYVQLAWWAHSTNSCEEPTNSFEILQRVRKRQNPCLLLLIIALLPVFALSAASQQAGGRGKASFFKTFARGCSLSLPVAAGRRPRMAACLELPTCARMPILGLGTWQVPAGAGDPPSSPCLRSRRCHQEIAENRGRLLQQSPLQVRKMQQILRAAFLAFWNISGIAGIDTCPSGNFLSKRAGSAHLVQAVSR